MGKATIAEHSYLVAFYDNWLLTNKAMWPAIIEHLPFLIWVIWGRLPLTKIYIWVHFQFTKIFEVVFKVNLYDAVFNLQKYLRLSFIYKYIWGCLSFTKIFEVVFHLQIYLRLFSNNKSIWVCLPLRKNFRSSSSLSLLSLTFQLG